MAKVTLKNLSLNYPVYGANARSLKSSLVNAATGGRLKKKHGSVSVEALKNINLELNNGDRLGLIGHNGAGKTTLLKVLAQIYTPSSGTIEINGRSNALFEITMGLDIHSTGYENIILRGLLFGLSYKEIQKIIPEIEAFAELGEFMKMPIKTYSSGMIVRLAFAIITSIPSEILIIDEVVNVGDAQFMDKAKKRLQELIHQSDILVLSTHEIEIMRQFCNKVIWLEHGAIKEMGDTKTILEKYQNYQNTLQEPSQKN